MNNDLISRADLWQKVVSHTYPVDILENEHKVITEVLMLIGNAPTVKPCENCDLYFKATTKEIDRWYKKEEQKGGAENG